MGKIRAILILAVLVGRMYPSSVQAQQSQPTLQINPSTVSVSVTAISAANSPVQFPVVFAVTGSPPPARINPNVAGVGIIPPGLSFPGYGGIAEPTPNNPPTLNSRVEINRLIVAALSKTTTYRVEYTATNPSGSATAVLLITVTVPGTSAQQQAQNQGGAQQNQSGTQQNQNQTGSQQTFQQQWQQLQQQQLGTRLSGRGTTVILRRRFNPKSGKVELIKNGVISRKGYLNLIGKNLNRRQSLRNYRFR